MRSERYQEPNRLTTRGLRTYVALIRTLAAGEGTRT
jgi:hypothetical protein